MKKILKFCAMMLASVTIFVGGGFLIARHLNDDDQSTKGNSSSSYFANAGNEIWNAAYRNLSGMNYWEDKISDVTYGEEIGTPLELAAALYGAGEGGDVDIMLSNDINMMGSLCNPLSGGSGTIRIDGQGYAITGINIIFDPAYVEETCGEDAAREYIQNAIDKELYLDGIGYFSHLHNATCITNVTFSGYIIFPATVPDILAQYGFEFSQVFGDSEVCVGGLAGKIESDVATVGSTFGIYFNIDCDASIGGIAGKIDGWSVSCYSQSYICRDPAMESGFGAEHGDIESESRIGGLFGYSASSVNLSYSYSSVNLKTYGASMVGGIVGETIGSICGCYSLYDRIVVVDSGGGTQDVGGIVGNMGSDGADVMIAGCFAMPAYYGDYPNEGAEVYPLAYACTVVRDCIWQTDDNFAEPYAVGTIEEGHNFEIGDVTYENDCTATELEIAALEKAASEEDWRNFYINTLCYSDFSGFSAEECFAIADGRSNNCYVNQFGELGIPQGYPGMVWCKSFGSFSYSDSGSSGGGSSGGGGSTTTKYYNLTYDGNGGTTSSGSSTCVQQVGSGKSFTTKSSSLFSKTGYKIVNWSTSENSVAGSYTGVSTTYTYTEGKDITLYAIWEVDNSFDVYMYIWTDTTASGTYEYGANADAKTMISSWSISYYYDNSGTTTSTKIYSSSASNYGQQGVEGLKGTTFSFSFTMNSGYQFVGYTQTTTYALSGTVTTSSSIYPTSTVYKTSYSFSFTPSTSGYTYVYVFVSKAPSQNQLKYDSTDNYFYFEDGYFPQSYVGDTLNSTLNSTNNITLDRNLQYLDASGYETTIPIYTYNSAKYAKVEKDGVKKWFKMEKIRWRVSDYGVSSTAYPSTWSKGTIVTNFKVVSDRILWVGAVTRATTTEGWSFDSSDMRTYFSNIYKKSGATVTDEVPKYAASYNEKYYYYGETGQQTKVKSSTSSYSGINIATKEEIEETLTDLKAKVSDMVAFILGVNDDSYYDYWTRELGQYIGGAKVITTDGIYGSEFLRNFNGVRFSLRMSEGSRV